MTIQTTGVVWEVRLYGSKLGPPAITYFVPDEASVRAIMAHRGLVPKVVNRDVLIEGIVPAEDARTRQFPETCETCGHETFGKIFAWRRYIDTWKEEPPVWQGGKDE